MLHRSLTLLGYTQALDAYLLAVPRRWQFIVILFTAAIMIAMGLQYVPRQYTDFSHTPLLPRIQQPDTYGPDTIADMYESKVVLNDIGDMYTKARLEQTALEAQTWSKEASAPYPPVMLLSQAGLYAAGERLGIGFYGTTLVLASAFLILSVCYFLQTRWYLFPLLYLNFSYFANRFVYVQDSSYLLLLVVIMAALFLARSGRPVTHVLMAIAITMKLSPLYYTRYIPGMSRGMASLFLAVLIVGLVLPYLIWDNYLYIYSFSNERTATDWPDVIGAVALVAPFTLGLWYVETKLDFDLEERVGWSLVPFTMFAGLLTNTARHLLIVLLVPDKRGFRNVAAAIGLCLHSLFPSVMRLGAVVFVLVGLLSMTLGYYLTQIGWDAVREDARHPIRTAMMMLGRRSGR